MPTTIPTPHAEFHPLRVAEVESLCADAVTVTFEVPDELADLYDFRAGQSLTLRLVVNGQDCRRNYSICSSEGARPRIAVREIPEGLFSTWLVRDLRPGDAVEVAPPSGRFSPDLEHSGRHVLIAAGSGITPILSIASSVLRDPASTATILYGNRRADTVMFADELADLKDRYPTRLELIHVLSREPREAELFTGRLDEHKLASVLRLLPRPGLIDHWWLCGPLGMVDGALGLLHRLEVPWRRIHQELFYVDEVPPNPVRHENAEVREVSGDVTVILDGRATTVTIPGGSSVLEGAQRRRPDLPFACKGGVCGTCRAKVTHGEVHMRRNFALEQSELDAGFILTCQSRPVTCKVTVDYDC